MKRERTTRETKVRVDLAWGGPAEVKLRWDYHGGVDEPIDEGLARHFLTTLLTYADLGGSVDAQGDLCHHVIEDTAITLGQALKPAGPVIRFHHVTIPMDDALVLVAIDAGGRPYYNNGLREASPLWDHVIRSLCHELAATVHVHVLSGHDPHHQVEAALKALGVCLHHALQTVSEVRSLKGEVRET